MCIAESPELLLTQADTWAHIRGQDTREEDVATDHWRGEREQRPEEGEEERRRTEEERREGRWEGIENILSSPSSYLKDFHCGWREPPTCKEKNEENHMDISGLKLRRW